MNIVWLNKSSLPWSGLVCARELLPVLCSLEVGGSLQRAGSVPPNQLGWQYPTTRTSADHLSYLYAHPPDHPETEREGTDTNTVHGLLGGRPPCLKKNTVHRQAALLPSAVGC